MARARNIKPGFFANDLLAEIEPLGRLLFAGLWTIADREGRIEDRVKKIKAQTLPYDDCDCNALLDLLDKHGFILRYSVDGNGYIQIVKWDEHQNPHVKEAESTIPAPCEHSTRTVQGNTFSGTSRADSLNLIPDSLNPITALVPSDAGDQLPKVEKHDCPHEKIIALYHEVLPQCPQVRDWTPARATQLRARWNEDKKRQSLEWWKEFFEYVASCDFLTGRTAKPFFADLEWITKSTNFVKIREGKYENREAA